MFNTNIPLYGICIILSIILGLIVLYKNTKLINLTKDEILALMIYIPLGAIFGAKYYTYFTHLSEYTEFDFLTIGISSYGALIGIIILLLVYSFQFKKKFVDLLYICIPSIPLMYSIGKIGCFLAGCCYGIEYNGLFSVTYNYSLESIQGLSLFPVQLCESIIFLAIFIYSYLLLRKENNKLKVVGQVFILCGAAKFALDFLRMSHIGNFLSTSQIVSLLFIGIGILLIILSCTKKDKPL